MKKTYWFPAKWDKSGKNIIIPDDVPLKVGDEFTIELFKLKNVKNKTN